MRNDLLQVQIREHEVESQKAKLQNGIALVRMMLAQYCGLADDQFQIAYDTTESILMAQRRDHQQALANTPEYQLLEKQVEAAQLQKKMAIGQNLPTVAVGAGYTYHNLLDRDHTFGMIFASVSVPISGWWGGSHAIKRKNIELLQAKEQLDDNAQLLKIRMQKSWNDVEEAYQQLDIAKRSIEQAEENLRLNRNFYQAGTCTMSDLLQAQLLYQQASDQYTDAFADYHNKVIEYRQAVGE
jgi:outer membrane protein TolC